MELLAATRSAHKLGEIREILAAVPGLRLVGLDEVGVEPSSAEDELEPYDTFEANAESKARYFHRITGIATLADDSGLVVDALAGRPGVHSKRFAPGDAEGLARDEANNRHLLELLSGVEPEGRTARYVCAVALVDGRGPARLFRGEAEGRIALAPRGDAGFGYDPLFVHADLGRTFAEASASEKHERSHRGAAFRALALGLARPAVE